MTCSNCWPPAASARSCSTACAARPRNLFRALRGAGIVGLHPIPGKSKGRQVRVEEQLQQDFSLLHTLGLYLVETLEELDKDDPSITCTSSPWPRRSSRIRPRSSTCKSASSRTRRSRR
ncbi:MAG: DUF3516 domain-containing protein [Deltaproteobacteria bacterium]|nr:DUF3516 domain-containing protein [Deltaproteobacteria bacterium]